MTGRPSWLQLGAAYFAIYVVWGSTYLAIRYALEGWPVMLMAGSRHLLAGTMLYAWARRHGGAAPTALQWRNTAIVGALLLVGGNGLVVWAETRMSSGLTAVLVATEPVWLVLMNWWFVSRKRPRGQVLIGLVLGFVGTCILAGPLQIGRGEAVDAWGAAAVIVAAFSWGLGSMFVQRSEVPRHAGLSTAMQMLCGGTLLLVCGGLAGEGASFHPAQLSLRTIESFGYLVIFGSLIGYSAYTWLLQVQSMDRVATYAFVNPGVAVLLGCTLGGEVLQPRAGIATAICLVAVLVIVTAQAPKETAGA